MRSLNELGAPDVQPSPRDAGDGGNAHRRLELAKWLSDWHLLSFLGTSGLVSEVIIIPRPPFFRVFIMLTLWMFHPALPFTQADAKVLIRVATSPNMENNPTVLDALLETESWQTLSTFARESART